MLSESVLSVRKELFPQNKTAVSDMPKVNIQKKVQQYQQYYQQLMNSYSGNSTTSAEGTSETTTEGK